MKIKRLAVADDIASAAQLVMGETSESVPVALVRGRLCSAAMASL